MIYFHTITQGVLFGLTLSLMAGPAFFSLLQTSISEGFKKGSHLAIGISISDIFIAFTAWYGLTSLFESQDAQKALAVAGGFFLVIFGIYTAMKRHATLPHPKGIQLKTRFQFKSIAKGFVFNIANPSIWIFWLIPVGVASSYPKANLQILFLLSILITVFSMDLMKCAIANELKRFMTDRVITYINRVIGGVLIVFGIYLILTLFIDITYFMPQITQNSK
ncbi:MAG: LysE family translocator [Bacteroidales bacterium]|nr:LysE family translocator [Bacteroidales bacterium]